MAEESDVLASRIADLLRESVISEAVEALGQPHPLAPWLVDWRNILSGEDDDEQWLVEPLFAKGRAHALYAGAKVGKSWVVQYVCACLATGRDVLGRRAGDPVHVLYIDYEQTPADLRDRILDDFGFDREDADALNEHLHYVLLPSIATLDSDEGGALVARAVEATGAELVVIDTMMRAVAGEENSADTFNAFYRATGLRLKALGVTWVRLDHAGKDATKGQRGSSAKDGDVDLVIRMERMEGGVILKATHRRLGWYPEQTKITVAKREDATYRIALAPESAKTWPAETFDVGRELDRLGVPVECTINQAQEALRDSGNAKRRAIVSSAVKWRKERFEVGNRPGTVTYPQGSGTKVEPQTITTSTSTGTDRELRELSSSSDLGTVRIPIRDAAVPGSGLEPWEEF